MSELRSPLSRGPVAGVRLRVLSLGAGVQSSTLALLAARGQVGPMPDCAIFADTGAEPAAVYEWLDWLEPQLPFPVHRVSEGNLADDLVRASSEDDHPGKSFLTRVGAPPFFTKGPSGPLGMLPRQCTKIYKLKPIRTKLRELLGLKPGQRAGSDPLVETWVGISLDEMQRIQESRDDFIANRWPLVELRWNRLRCKQWMLAEFGRLPPRSACVFCPYMDNEERRAVMSVPTDAAMSIRVDEALRRALRKDGHELFVHSSCAPLAVADLSDGRDPSQLSMLDECDGMCGT